MIELQKIKQKVASGERLSEDDARRLFDTDILEIGHLADEACQRRHGDRVWYNVNRHINYTNVCANRCGFCAFGCDPEEERAYRMGLDEVLEEAAEAARAGATEIHIVGGLNAEIPFDFYLEMLATVKADLPDLHLKAFTAVEIDYFARESGQSVELVLQELKEAGLSSMPGGGAEILPEPTRSKICPEKISGERWLEIHEVAHRLGIKTNATMLFGHVESVDDRIEHLRRLRTLQDATGGFQAFVPLVYQAKNNPLGSEKGEGPDGIDILKTIAVSRLYLDNVPTIKAYWVMMGVKLAQVALCFGANDLDGTVTMERIGHDAGAESPVSLSIPDLRSLIEAAGRIPVERDSLYQPVVRG